MQANESNQESLYIALLFGFLKGILDALAANKSEAISPPDDMSGRVYFMRMRSVDSSGNIADWSNLLSASFFDPEKFKYPVSDFTLVLKIRYHLHRTTYRWAVLGI